MAVRSIVSFLEFFSKNIFCEVSYSAMDSETSNFEYRMPKVPPVSTAKILAMKILGDFSMWLCHLQRAAEQGRRIRGLEVTGNDQKLLQAISDPIFNVEDISKKSLPQKLGSLLWAKGLTGKQ